MNRLLLRWAMAAVALAVVAGAAGAAQAEVITCSSRDNDYNFCPADTANGVTLRRQLSHSDCVFNRSWGFDRRGVWVDKGCRGEFQVAGQTRDHDWKGNRDHSNGPDRSRGYGYGYGYGDGRGSRKPRQVIDCASDGETRYCRVPVYDHVELVEQFSRSDCTYPRTWGFDRNGIYVDEGCRGRFAVY